MPSSNYQPTFQPIYSGGGYHPQASIQILNSQGRTEEAQKEMELAFERALEDARAQTGRGSGDVRVEGDEMEGVEDRGQAKGDLEAVWESLRPEAERLGQLAEWERDFSQVSHPPLFFMLGKVEQVLMVVYSSCRVKTT